MNERLEKLWKKIYGFDEIEKLKTQIEAMKNCQNCKTRLFYCPEVVWKDCKYGNSSGGTADHWTPQEDVS